MNRLQLSMIRSALSVILCCGMFQLSVSGAEAKMPIAKIGKNEVKLEVAATPEEITRGLMFRTSMPKDQGMVFLFQPPRPVKFWMFQCFISLDMLFIKDGKIVKISENVPPCKSKDPKECATYPEEEVLVSEVVEVNAGYCKEHDIKEGDTVTFEMPKTK